MKIYNENKVTVNLEESKELLPKKTWQVLLRVKPVLLPFDGPPSLATPSSSRTAPCGC